MTYNLQYQLKEAQRNKQKAYQLHFDARSQPNHTYMAQTSLLDHNIRIAKTVKKYSCRVLQIPQQVHLPFQQPPSPNSTLAAARLLSSYSSSQNRRDPKSSEAVSQVIEQAYRAMERFLIEDCGKQIKPICKESLRQLIPILVSFHKNLPEEQAVTFLSFIRATFGLAITFVSQFFAAKLEWTIMQISKRLQKKPSAVRAQKKPRQTKQRPKEKGAGKERNTLLLQDKNPIGKNLFKRETETDKLNKIWNQRLQASLLKWIKENEYFLKIRDEFRKQFPQHQDILTVESLKNRYYKILRAGLKKLKWLQTQLGGLPEMERLDDTHVKYILRSSEGHKARKCLIQVYTMKEGKDYSSRLQVATAVEVVNNCIIQ